MNITPNYGLGQPLATEKYDVNVFNNNATLIDTALAEKQNQLTAGNNITIEGNTISAVDTTYQSLTESSGSSAVSLVTRGEKYTWNHKQDELNIDDAPTSGSDNVVKSGGVYSSLQRKADSSSLAAVATSGSYTDLENTPTLATVATSGSYNDLEGTPTLSAVATSGSYNDLEGTPTLATVATSGSYNDLEDTPSIPSEVTVDTALSTTSTNPVQNKIVTSEARLKTWIGTCSSAADAQAKVATVDSGFTLTKGVRIGIKFTYTNTFSNATNTPITLNVNSTGAVNIWYNTTHSGAGNTGTNTVAYGYASRYNYYVYDGTYWVWDGSSLDNNTTYSAISQSEITAGTATTSRVVRADYLKAAIDALIAANVVVNTTGTASATDVSYQRIGINGTYYEIKGTKYMSQTKTLSTSASTTYTFTNSAITTSSRIEVYASVYGLSPSSVTVSSGSCSVVFPSYSSATSVTVRIYIM